MGDLGLLGIPYPSTCQPVPRVDMSRGKYMSSCPYGYSVLFHLSTCLPGLTGGNIGDYGLMDIPYLSTCQPGNLSTRVDRSIHLYIGVQGIMGTSYLFTCRPVNLSASLPGLTGQEVNIGVQGIRGISYLSPYRPVNLSTRVDR